MGDTIDSTRNPVDAGRMSMSRRFRPNDIEAETPDVAIESSGWGASISNWGADILNALAFVVAAPLSLTSCAGQSNNQGPLNVHVGQAATRPDNWPGGASFTPISLTMAEIGHILQEMENSQNPRDYDSLQTLSNQEKAIFWEKVAEYLVNDKYRALSDAAHLSDKQRQKVVDAVAGELRGKTVISRNARSALSTGGVARTGHINLILNVPLATEQLDNIIRAQREGLWGEVLNDLSLFGRCLDSETGSIAFQLPVPAKGQKTDQAVDAKILRKAEQDLKEPIASCLNEYNITNKSGKITNRIRDLLSAVIPGTEASEDPETPAPTQTRNFIPADAPSERTFSGRVGGDPVSITVTGVLTNPDGNTKGLVTLVDTKNAEKTYPLENISVKRIGQSKVSTISAKFNPKSVKNPFDGNILVADVVTASLHIKSGKSDNTTINQGSKSANVTKRVRIDKAYCQKNPTGHRNCFCILNPTDPTCDF